VIPVGQSMPSGPMGHGSHIPRLPGLVGTLTTPLTILSDRSVYVTLLSWAVAAVAAGIVFTAVILLVCFLEVRDDGGRGQQQRGDRRGVLKRDALNLGGDQHAHGDHVAILFGHGIEAEIGFF